MGNNDRLIWEVWTAGVSYRQWKTTYEKELD